MGGSISSMATGYSSHDVRGVASVTKINRTQSVPSGGGETVDEEYGYIWTEDPASFILGGIQLDFKAKDNLSISAVNRYDSSEQNAKIDISYYYADSAGTVSQSPKSASTNGGAINISDIANEYDTQTVYAGVADSLPVDTTITVNGGDSVDVTIGTSVIYKGENDDTWRQYLWNGLQWVEDILSIHSLQVFMSATGTNVSSYGPRVSPNLVTSAGYNAAAARSYQELTCPAVKVFRSTDIFEVADYLGDNIEYTIQGTIDFKANRPYRMETKKKTEVKTVYPYTIPKDKSTSVFRPYVVLNAMASDTVYKAEPTTSWKAGRLTDNNGAHVGTKSRISTVKFFRADTSGDGTVFTHAYYVQSVGGYKFSVYAYDSNKVFQGCLTTKNTWEKTDNKNKLVADVQWLTFFDLRNPDPDHYYYKFVLQNGEKVTETLDYKTHFAYCNFVEGTSDVFYEIYRSFAEDAAKTANTFAFSGSFSKDIVKTPSAVKNLRFELDTYTPNPKGKDWANADKTKLDHSWSIRPFVIRPTNSEDAFEGAGSYIHNIELPKTTEVSLYASDDQRFLRNVRLSKVEKGELNKFGSLEIKAEFECLSPWKEPFSGYLFHGTAAEIATDSFNSNFIVVDSDSSSMSPCELAIEPQMNNGHASFVNPQWEHWVNGVKVSEGKYNGTLQDTHVSIDGVSIPVIQALFINSDPASHNVYIRSILRTTYLGVTTTPISNGSTVTSIAVGGETVNVSPWDSVVYNSNKYVWYGSTLDNGAWKACNFGSVEEDSYEVVSTTNAYGNLDFTKSNFIYIRQGQNVIKIKDDNNNTKVDIRLRGNILHESV